LLTNPNFSLIHINPTAVQRQAQKDFMTTPEQVQVQEQQNNKELNFRALEQRYQKQLEDKDRQLQELQQRQVQQAPDDDEDDNEPYVDHKKLKKAQAKFGQQIKQETQTEIQRAVQAALHEERSQNWLKQNPDFYETMSHAEKLAQMDPDLADTILAMPDNFERKKLVYKNIKALGLHKPAEKVPSIQDKIDANKKSPYYQPSGYNQAPYSAQSDFSPQGQKESYEKMKMLKAKYGS
jgi:hypothetical protein